MLHFAALVVVLAALLSEDRHLLWLLLLIIGLGTGLTWVAAIGGILFVNKTMETYYANRSSRRRGPTYVRDRPRRRHTVLPHP